MRSLSPPQIAGLSCVMEVMCPKPGNVSPGRPAKYMNDLSFLASALGLAAAFEDGGGSVGGMAEEAAARTKDWVNRNTNLGMILLLAPLVKASRAGAPDRAAVREVLENLNQEDSRRICEAIRIAAPEGLGGSEKYDVRGGVPPIMDAMRFAADRDSVAGEYASGFGITFGRTAPSLTALWREGHCLKKCILQVFLMLLAELPDTLIARKLGPGAAQSVSRGADGVLRAGGALTREGRECARAFDASLSHPGNLLNPGTTADLTTAGIFVFLSEELREGGLPHILERWEDDGRE